MYLLTAIAILVSLPANAVDGCLTRDLVGKLLENKVYLLANRGDGDWRTYLKEVPEFTLPAKGRKILKQIRTAGGEGRAVRRYGHELVIQLTKAPREEVFSPDFYKISRAILRKNHDFFISLGWGLTGNQGAVYVENRFSDKAIASFTVGAAQLRAKNLIRHEFRHFLDWGRRDEAFLKSLKIPRKVQKAISDLLRDGPNSQSGSNHEMIQLFLDDFLKWHSEVRAHREQLFRFLSLRGLIRIPISQLPLETFNALNDLLQLSKYSLKAMNVAWHIDPLSPRTLYLTLTAAGYTTVAIIIMGAAGVASFVGLVEVFEYLQI